jgi:hypothetical protein
MPCLFGPRHRFQNERRNRVRAFELDDFLEHRQRLLGRVPSALNPVIRIQHVHDAGHPGLGGPAPWIPGQHHAAGGCAVVRAIPGQDLVATGCKTRKFDRVLVGLGSAVGEEKHVDVARRDLGELCAQARAGLGCHERVRVRKRGQLILDRPNHAFVAMTDVHAHQLAVEVDEPLAFGRVEVDPLRVRDGNRIHLRLRRPFEERMLLRQRNHLFSGHRLQRVDTHCALLQFIPDPSPQSLNPIPNPRS